jgi:hypothetical protein
LVNGGREWHAELEDAQFGYVLLQELENMLLRIEASWLEGISIRIITTLTSRLLASTYDPAIKKRACQLLLKARQVTFKWVHQLVKKLQESEDDITVQEFQRRVCEMAAICRGTFDPDHTPSLLVSTEDVQILVYCAILVYDNRPLTMTGVPLGYKRILDHDRRLSTLLEAALREKIQTFCHGLDLAIGSVWTAYRPGTEWRNLEAPNDHWVITTTAIGAAGYQEPQFVQFNLLDGRLLINGKPLGRLPANIVNHPIYARVLGRVSTNNMYGILTANINSLNRRSWILFLLIFQEWIMPLEI